MFRGELGIIYFQMRAQGLHLHFDANHIKLYCLIYSLDFLNETSDNAFWELVSIFWP